MPNARALYRTAGLSAYISMVSCSSKPVGSPTMWRSSLGSPVAIVLRCWRSWSVLPSSTPSGRVGMTNRSSSSCIQTGHARRMFVIQTAMQHGNKPLSALQLTPHHGYMQKGFPSNVNPRGALCVGMCRSQCLHVRQHTVLQAA